MNNGSFSSLPYWGRIFKVRARVKVSSNSRKLTGTFRGLNKDLMKYQVV